MTEMTRDQFVARFRAEVEGMSWNDIARVCKASLPTVTRWYYGASTPHHLARESVFVALAQHKKDSAD